MAPSRAVDSPANSTVVRSRRSLHWQGARGRPAEHDARYGDRRRTSRSGARRCKIRHGRGKPGPAQHRDVSAAAMESRGPLVHRSMHTRRPMSPEETNDGDDYPPGLAGDLLSYTRPGQ